MVITRLSLGAQQAQIVPVVAHLITDLSTCPGKIKAVGNLCAIAAYKVCQDKLTIRQQVTG